MKNKLTLEEQALSNKLSEAGFTYEESNWAEMQQMIGKKGGFFSNYGTFFKAAIAFVAIVGSVVLMNNFYPEDKSSITTVSNPNTEEKTPIEKENIQEKETIKTDKLEEAKEDIGSATNEITPEKNISANLNDIASEEKQNTETLVTNEENNEPESGSEKTIKNKKENAQENQLPFIELIHVEIDGALCLNYTARFTAKIRGKYKDGITFKWLMNNNVVEGNKIVNSIKIPREGLNNVKVEAYYNDILLGTAHNSFEAEEKVELDFEATDLTDPFYDQNVNLKSTVGDHENLKWFVNKRDKIQMGKETAWFFENEGTYEMTLQHTSAYGCVSTVTKPVSMQKDFIATAPLHFTPNGDGTNETFKIDAFTLLEDIKFQMKVINQQGETVFQTNNPNEGWNGRLNNKGKLLPANTYAWSVEIENKNNRKRLFNGKIKVLNF